MPADKTKSLDPQEQEENITLEEAERMKQAWRDEDERAIRTGEKTAAEVNQSNSWAQLSGDPIDYAASERSRTSPSCRWRSDAQRLERLFLRQGAERRPHCEQGPRSGRLDVGCPEGCSDPGVAGQMGGKTPCPAAVCPRAPPVIEAERAPA